MSVSFPAGKFFSANATLYQRRLQSSFTRSADTTELMQMNEVALSVRTATRLF